MKVSIITVSFNSAKTIADTITSVLSQSYQNIELIVKDGLSSDSTLDVIKKFDSDKLICISESDKGLYDAMNTGIMKASGDIIGMLNSDDFYTHADVIQKVVDCFQNDVDAVYADLVYVDANNTDKIKRVWKSGEYREGLFLKGWMPPHPTFFVRREVYEKYGLFTDKLKSAADYEMMLRLIHKHKIKLKYLPEIIVKMRVGGASNSSIKNRLRANKEDRLAWKLNGLKPSPITFIRKPLSKISQFFKK